MDVCIHGMCKIKRGSNEKMEKIRVLAISPIWAPLSSSPKFRKEKRTFAYINTRSPRLTNLSLFQAWGRKRESLHK